MKIDLIGENAPGICSQEDFNHDWDVLSEAEYRIHSMLYTMKTFASEKGYTIPGEQ